MVSNQTQQQIINTIQIGKNNELNVNQQMGLVINLSCINKAKIDNDIQNTIANEISQSAVSQGVDIGLSGGTTSEINNEIITKIRSSINMDTITNASIISTQKQLIESGAKQLALETNKATFSQGMTAEMLMEALTDTIKSNKFITTLTDKIDGKTGATTKSTITEIVGSVMGFLSTGAGMVMIVVVIFMIISAVVFKTMFGGKAGSDNLQMLLAARRGNNSSSIIKNKKQVINNK
jgi:hypothetical protein